MNDLNKTNLSLSYYQFGPIIGRYDLTADFSSELSKRGNLTHIDNRHNLAGHIEKENSFSKDDKRWFLENTSVIFDTYLRLLVERSLVEKKPPKSLNLQNLWINFMKKGEFNPPHYHDGDISFVIYTAVPNEIINENKNFTGRGFGPGTISFFYGEHNSAYKTEINFLPAVGNMFLFPATLRHFVPPYKSDVIRESISGNISFVY